MSTPSKPLLVTLAITLALTAWAMTQGDDESAAARTVQPKGPRDRGHSIPGSASRAPLTMAARTLAPLEADPFASRIVLADEVPMALPEEEPPMPAKAAAAEPAAPEPAAPKAPFKYLGSLKQDKRLVYFLTGEDKVFTVAAGERLTNDYELTAVANDSVTLTYLPLGQAQTLPIEK